MDASSSFPFMDLRRKPGVAGCNGVCYIFNLGICEAGLLCELVYIENSRLVGQAYIVRPYISKNQKKSQTIWWDLEEYLEIATDLSHG